MAWQAELKKDVAPDYQTGKLLAVVEFYDDVDRPGTSFIDTFSIEVGQGTTVEQRGELRKAVEERGKQVRALYGRAVAMRVQVPVGATIAIP